MTMLWVLIIAIGLSIGSFLNVLISRVPAGKSISGRSQCPQCHAAIRWYDLMPLLSFFFLQGKCRSCARGIPWRYPVVELITAAVFGALFFVYKETITSELVFLWGVSVGLIVLAGCDFEEFILPDGILISLTVFILGFKSIFAPTDLVSMCVTGFLLALGFGILFIASRGAWLGLGDVKLALVVGLALSFPLSLLATLIAIWSASIVGVSLVLMRRASLKSALPFGTFLSLASIIAIIFHNELIKFSEQLFW